jgi:hypothetical protein
MVVRGSPAIGRINIVFMPQVGNRPSLLCSVQEVSKRHCVLPRNWSLEKNQVPREWALIAISLVCLVTPWNSYGGSWKWVTISAYPSYDCPAVVCHFFWILSYVHQQQHSLDCQNFAHHNSLVFFLPILGPFLVQGFIFSLNLFPYRSERKAWICPWNVLYHTSLRNYASSSRQVPSNLSILLGSCFLHFIFLPT